MSFQGVFQYVSDLVAKWGYSVAFFGLLLENMGIPVPAETALVIVSFLAFEQKLNIFIVWPLAILGDALGDNIGYWIGYFGGRPLINRFGKYVRLTPDKVKKSEKFFEKHGEESVFAGQFWSISRVSIALIAGISKMRYWKFVIFDGLAAAVYTSIVIFLTYIFHENLEALVRTFKAYNLIILIVVLVLLVGYLIYRKKRKDLTS